MKVTDVMKVAQLNIAAYRESSGGKDEPADTTIVRVSSVVNGQEYGYKYGIRDKMFNPHTLEVTLGHSIIVLLSQMKLELAKTIVNEFLPEVKL